MNITPSPTIICTYTYTGACDVMVIIVGNGLGKMSSNLG